MNSNVPVVLLVGAVSLAAVAGVTYALMQSSSKQASVTLPVNSPSVAQSPSPTQSSTPASSLAPTQSPVSQDPLPQPNSTTQTAARQVESCRVAMAIVNDPDSPLNVRSAPTTEASKVVGQLQNGTMVMVTQEQAGWFQIESPMKGWISKQRTTNGCNQKVERVQFGTNDTSMTIADRFIGAGSHKYLLTVSNGQTMTITRKEGPFPTLITPTGKQLVEGPYSESRRTWTEQLSQTGDYGILLESNYKGYPYAFTVEIK